MDIWNEKFLTFWCRILVLFIVILTLAFSCPYLLTLGHCDEFRCYAGAIDGSHSECGDLRCFYFLSCDDYGKGRDAVNAGAGTLAVGEYAYDTRSYPLQCFYYETIPPSCATSNVPIPCSEVCVGVRIHALGGFFLSCPGSGTVSGGGWVRVGETTPLVSASHDPGSKVTWTNARLDTPPDSACTAPRVATSHDTGGIDCGVCFMSLPRSYSMTVSHKGSGSGKTSGNGSYVEGSEVVLSATADAGSYFVDWHCDGVWSDGTFPMPSHDVNCIANFLKINFVRTINTGSGSGYITGGSRFYYFGDDVILTATANSGSTFAGWSGDPVCGNSKDLTISFSMPDHDVNCTATFNQNIPIVTGIIAYFI